MHFGDPGIFEAEALPHPTGLTQIDVDPRVRKMLLAVVGQGWRGGHIQPAVTVQVGQDHISVIGGGQETLVSRDI